MHVRVWWGGFPSLLSPSEDVDGGERIGRDEIKKGWEMGWDLVSDARPCGRGGEREGSDEFKEGWDGLGPCF